MHPVRSYGKIVTALTYFTGPKGPVITGVSAEPDRMYINPNQIVFVETVGTNSTVAQHIAQGPH